MSSSDTRLRTADLLKALLHLAPTHEGTIREIAEATKLQMSDFCKGIRKQIGGTLLFDAVLMLNGSARSPSEASVVAALFKHSIQCRSTDCTQPDCLQLRTMLSSMKVHAQSCSTDGCKTCLQWQVASSRMKRARSSSTAEDIGANLISATATVAQKLPQDRALEPTSGGRRALPQLVLSSTAGPEVRAPPSAALLLLARSALADLPVSMTRVSPMNSPSSSPNPTRKRPKSRAPVGTFEGSRTHQINRDIPALGGPTGFSAE